MTTPESSHLIEPEALEQRLGQPDILIVDLRNPDGYAAGHIPGAVNLAYAELVRAEPPVMGLLPDTDRLSRVLSTLGLTPQHQVIAYDDEGGGRAGRLLFTLNALGHRGLMLLNGGFRAWSAEQRPLSREIPAPQPSGYQAEYRNTDAVADKDYIRSRLGQDDFALLDARTPAEYQGQDRRAARGGHIPGAVSMNWTDAIDQRNHLRLLPDEVLKNRLGELGITADKEVVVYCQTHHRSAHTYMMLKHLGFERLRGYPGAWSDWGNDPDTPVEP